VDSFESLAVKLVTGRSRLNIAGLYRPPSTSPYGVGISSFCDNLSGFVDELLSLSNSANFLLISYCMSFNAVDTAAAMAFFMMTSTSAAVM